MASFQIECPTCRKKVHAATILNDHDLKVALSADAPIRVMHVTDREGDHIWSLGSEERKNLAKTVAAGLI